MPPPGPWVTRLALTVQLTGIAVAAPVPPNVDVSQRAHNESEETIAVNPTDPDNIVIVSRS